MMRLTATLACLLPALAVPAVAAAEDDPVARGKYLFRAGACDSCHTDVENGGAFLAGGRALDTQFGTFYVPNITPAPETGIGGWSDEDFRDAMIEGMSPDGATYYPIFPYRWYTGMTAEDIGALKAYLDTVEPVENEVPEHELIFPFNIRPFVYAWRLLNFESGETVADPERSEQWNRGAYLVNHLGHCGACHTPKDLVGNFLDFLFLAGSNQIPGPLPAPNITPHDATGIGSWSHDDLARALQRAMLPDGTPIRGSMAEYVHVGSSHLSDDDIDAMAAYLGTIEPVDRQPTQDLP